MAPNQAEIAEALQACLELIQDEKETLASVLARFPDQADFLRPDLEAALWFRERTQLFNPRPGYASASRARMVARINRSLLSGARERLPSTGLFGWLAWRKTTFRLAMVFVMFVVFFSAGSGIALTSQGSLPGETLYPVKTALENVSLALSLSGFRDARLHIEFAQRRILEVQSLVLEGRYENVPAVVAAFEKHIDQSVLLIHEIAAASPAQAKILATALQDTLSRQVTLMEVMAVIVPDHTKLAFERMQQTSNTGLAAANEILILATSTPAATATPTTVFISNTLTPGASPTGTPSATALPTSTLGPAQIASPTSTFSAPFVPATTVQAPAAPTATKTVTPTRVIKPTPKPSKTAKPTKTPKSAPEPTRRPPRPY